MASLPPASSRRGRPRGAGHWQAPAHWSCVGIPAGAQGQAVLDFLVARFPRIDAQTWRHRLARQQVRDVWGQPLHAEQPLGQSSHLYYEREVADEITVPFEPQVLYRDERLLVVDKPHFLPVAPAGQHAEQTVLRRLQARFADLDLAPLHRLDKDTAGLVLFSIDAASRPAYHALFRSRAVDKEYEAVARWDARLARPLQHASRLVEGGPRFFTMCEVPGEPNSLTHLEMIERHGAWARYRLRPVTGKKHQLRVHMAALGVPIRHDPFYPEINDPPPGDFSRPLQLLARELCFLDPVDGQARAFRSMRTLQWPPAGL